MISNKIRKIKIFIINLFKNFIYLNIVMIKINIIIINLKKIIIRNHQFL